MGTFAPFSPLSFSEGHLNARGNSLRFISHHPGVPPPLSPGPTKERSLPCQVGCGDQLRSSRAELYQFVQPAPAEKTPRSGGMSRHMVPHSRGCHSRDRQVMALSLSLYGLSAPLPRVCGGVWRRGARHPLPLHLHAELTEHGRSFFIPLPSEFLRRPGELTARVFAGTRVGAQFHAG